jgi:uncharacterized integral membrane protein
MKYVNIARKYVRKFFALPPAVVFLNGVIVGYVIKMIVG